MHETPVLKVPVFRGSEACRSWCLEVGFLCLVLVVIKYIIIIKIENEKPFVNRLFRLQIIVILADIYARKC